MFECRVDLRKKKKRNATLQSIQGAFITAMCGCDPTGPSLEALASGNSLDPVAVDGKAINITK